MDTRVVERNVDRGVLAAKDVTSALKGLPDDAENAEYVAIDSLVDEDAKSNGAH